ncbi:DUF3885 domain-containing protein [Priestia megaterium]|uniref:DUF3885 domain-containing protein n=1 Tax=Priestia megaterium TaxID=1404 RepID=UPI002E1AD85C|nr:DUF3885 domain-containing protein [Priestia megaterium]
MSTNTLSSFLKEYCEGLTLRPALFYSWKYSIRFQISDPLISSHEKDCLNQAFHRSITLFQRVFGEGDEILFVTDVHTTNKDLFLQKRPLNVYLKYIKDKKRLYQLNHHCLPSVFQDEDEDDDRGCDVLASSKESIRFLYEEYNNWILDYDREEIDLLFR